MKRNDLKLCPYEDDIKTPIVKEIRGKEVDTVGIFIGPEGGIADEELAKLKESGARVVTLGPRIFRTETASLVASSIVQYELGDLGGLR